MNKITFFNPKARELQTWMSRVLVIPLCKAMSFFDRNYNMSFTLAANSNVDLPCLKTLGILCEEGRLKEALDILHLMDQRAIYPSIGTYAIFFRGCVNMKAPAEAKVLHAHMIQCGFEAENFLRNLVFNVYAKCGSMEDARQVFDEMPQRDLVLWSGLIASYARNGFSGEAFRGFLEMQRTGTKPNQFTFGSVLKACSSLESIEHGEQVHACVIKSGLELDLFARTAVIDMYVKCRRMEYARQLFDKVAQRSVVPWTVLIAGYIQMGSGEQALELFWQMPKRDLVSWTVVISGFAQNGLAGEALKMFSLMRRTGMKPNQFTLASVLKASASLAALEHGKMLHAEILKFGFESDVFAGTAIVDMYAKCDFMEDARKLFEKMTKHSSVLWSSMISGYTQSRNGEEALRLFRGMQEACNGVNEFAFSSVLRACADLAVLEQGKQFHACAIKTGFESNTYVGSALLDMYSKCGSIEDACQLFDELPDRNGVAWNAMIVGCAQHGRSKAVFTLYKQMQLAGLKPDQVTFVGILFACAHVGLTEEGHYYFESMHREYGISPRLEHYTCMVGLLGRVGCLYEAEDLINKMPLEPDSVVWRTLLAACSIHGNMELGKRVAEFVLELEPQDDASYVLLSNIYAAAGKWEDVAKTRKLMKAIRLRKDAGCSWIEVKNRVHTFKTGDRSHPQTEEIYKELGTLMGQIRKEGYVPNTDFVLHDLKEEQKEDFLCHHSEKLAIALGLVSTPAGTCIRVIKNLRVCGDCHSAIKLISKIVGREIVMRDANRFHHFKDGLCTCGDYW